MTDNRADGLTVQQADALWDAVAIPGPHTPTFTEQHERVCRAVAGILAELPAAAPPTGQTALREDLERVLHELHLRAEFDAAEDVDAVLAVLPLPADRAEWDALCRETGRLRKASAETVDRAAYIEAEVQRLVNIRAAVLREAADVLDTLPADATSFDKAEHKYKGGAAAERLRRMAAEAQQQPETEAHPAEHTWAAELHDPLADEWVPGTRYLVRDRAVNALAHAQRLGPTWKDGTPTQRRLVRATTTYTVEQPASGRGAADEEQPS